MFFLSFQKIDEKENSGIYAYRLILQTADRKVIFKKDMSYWDFGQFVSGITLPLREDEVSL